MDGKVGQHFAIHLNIGLLQAMNKLTVVQIVQAGSRIDTRNPEATEIALAIAAVAEGIEERLEHGFVGAAEKPMFGTKLAFGKFQNFFMPTMGINLWS
jgi:hypothetical protein